MQTAAAPCTTRGGPAGRGVYSCAHPHSPGPPKPDLCRADRAGQEFFASGQWKQKAGGQMPDSRLLDALLRPQDQCDSGSHTLQNSYERAFLPLLHSR